MAMKHYLSFTHKFHNQLLSTLCKHSVIGVLPHNVYKGSRERVFNNTAFSVHTIESNPPNSQTSNTKHQEGVPKKPEPDFYELETVSQTERPERLKTASDSVLHNKKSSPAAQKYFKKTFQDKYPFFIRESEKNRDDNIDHIGTLGNAALDDHERKWMNFKDERDPNERLSEMMPEDFGETQDRRLNIPLTREGRIGKNAYYYTRKMSILGRQGKIKEAINVFDHWMMIRDRVMPNKRTFNVLIGILGRVGYTEKAFELYKKMRNLGLDAEDQVYTGLLNACANSPWPKQSLKQAENLLNALQDKGIRLNLITLKAAAKAMAFCGNFSRAFTIMDEASTYMSLDVECFDHLLMACAADKQRGFCRALQVWQKMQESNILPETSTFNLLIRTVRDCGIGEPDEFAKTLGLSSGKSKIFGHNHLLTSGQPRQSEDDTNLQLLLPEMETVHSGQSHLRPLSVTSALANDNMTKSFARKKDTVETHLQKPQSHNLFHDIPNFDQDIEDFLSERAAHRERSGSADIYEWWEEQPSDMQQQSENHLSLLSQSDWPDQETHYTNSETKFEALSGDVDNEHVTKAVPVNSETLWSKSIFHTTERTSAKYPSSSDPKGFEVVPHEIKQKLLQTSLGQEGDFKGDVLVKDITTPTLRLALLGGACKLVLHMSQCGASPNVRTFSQLVPCLPSSEQAENNLLQLMKEMEVTPDVDLINDIMLKRNFRHSSDTAKELLPVMSKLGLMPNMRTYAALALTCVKEHDAHQLLSDMKAANLEPSSKVMGHMIYISRTNFSYKLHMLQRMEWMGLPPLRETVTAIEKSIAITKKNIIAAEHRKDTNSYYLSSKYQESFRRFLNFYKGWLQRTTLHETHHPWKAFQNDVKDEETNDE